MGRDNIIGIDVGYGRTKFHSDTAEGSVPSAVSSQVAEETFDRKLSPVVVAGQAYLTGEEALIHSRSCEDPRHSGFLASPGWFALLGTALYKAKFDPLGGTLVLGLPPGEASEEREAWLARTVRGTSVLIPKAGLTFRFDHTRIIIIPQAAGIFYHYAAHADVDAFDLDIAVVDIGHQTVDMVYISGGGYVERLKRTLDLGVGGEIDAIAQMARSSAVPRKVRHGDIVAGIFDGSLFDAAHPHYVAGAEEHLAAYTRNLVSQIDQFMESLPSDPYGCVVAGGGAPLLRNQMGLYRSNLLVAEEPEMANARGYWTYASWLDEEEAHGTEG